MEVTRVAVILGTDLTVMEKLAKVRKKRSSTLLIRDVFVVPALPFKPWHSV